MIDGVPRCRWCESQIGLDADLDSAVRVVCPRCGRAMLMCSFVSFHSYALPEDAEAAQRLVNRVCRWASRSTTPTPASPGTVYLVGCGTAGPVKIGFTTKEPAERIAALQTGSPETLHLLGSFPGTQADEQRLHRQLAAQRLHGEWFRRCGSVVDAFRRAS